LDIRKTNAGQKKIEKGKEAKAVEDGQDSGEEFVEKSTITK
jgi:hypothetical protein